VDAEGSVETGLVGYVRTSKVGAPHNKIVFYRRLDGPPDSVLSRMLADGRQHEG
jgi:hypothetical protein